jgi:hypothetical protein
MTELRLTVGEIAFAVGVVSTIDRALDIVSVQLEAPEPERARMALAASGQSLLARELATRRDRDVVLVPPLQSAAEIIAAAEWMVRCIRVAGKRTEHLLFHIAPTGVVAQAVEGLVVHRLAPVAGVGALIDRASGFFALPPVDIATDAVRLPRDVLEELGRLSKIAELGRELTRRGVPEAMSRPFAADLADAAGKGAVSVDHTPRGTTQPARSQAWLTLVVGARRWLIDTHEPDAAVIGEASRQRFAAAIEDLLRSLDSTTRAFDRAGELER